EVRPSFVGLAIVVEGRADNHIGIAVTIDVTRRLDGEAQLRAQLIALRRPGCGRRWAGGRAEEEIRPPLARLAVVVVGGADEDIREAVAIDVPRGGDRLTERGARLVALSGPRGGGRKARGRAQVEIRESLVG